MSSKKGKKRGLGSCRCGSWAAGQVQIYDLRFGQTRNVVSCASGSILGGQGLMRLARGNSGRKEGTYRLLLRIRTSYGVPFSNRLSAKRGNGDGTRLGCERFQVVGVSSVITWSVLRCVVLLCCVGLISMYVLPPNETPRLFFSGRRTGSL